MNEDTVIQVLTHQAVPHSVIIKLIDAAIKYRSAQSTIHRVKLVNTNNGMPAEFRIERI